MLAHFVPIVHSLVQVGHFESLSVKDFNRPTFTSYLLPTRLSIRTPTTINRLCPTAQENEPAAPFSCHRRHIRDRLTPQLPSALVPETPAVLLIIKAQDNIPTVGHALQPPHRLCFKGNTVLRRQ